MGPQALWSQGLWGTEKAARLWSWSGDSVEVKAGGRAPLRRGGEGLAGRPGRWVSLPTSVV